MSPPFFKYYGESIVIKLRMERENRVKHVEYAILLGSRIYRIHPETSGSSGQGEWEQGINNRV